MEGAETFLDYQRCSDLEKIKMRISGGGNLTGLVKIRAIERGTTVRDYVLGMLEREGLQGVC